MVESMRSEPLSSATADESRGVGAARTLHELIAAEVDGGATPQTDVFVDEIRRRHGDAVRAVLYYGSCLRKHDAAEGVLDFYAVVDSYGAAYERSSLALTNAWLPPNVYYVELPGPDGGRFRAKYNVISAADFSACARGRSLHAIVWGRFSQPFRILYARDNDARGHVIGAAADCVRTMMALACDLEAPSVGELQHGGLGRRLWSRGLRETYGTELRTESGATIDALYDAAAGRYDRACELALAERAAGARAQSPAVWRLRKRAAKAVYFFRLLKSAWTFGEWLPYALWKFERHTGTHIELTQAQRRHPLIYGWPVIVRVLREKQLR